MTKIPLKFLDPDRDPDQHQNRILIASETSHPFRENMSTTSWVISKMSWISPVPNWQKNPSKSV